MEFLSEDPTYLAGGLGLLAAAFLVALRVTQQGKYLVRALAALALAAAVLLVEWLWVTDGERIEGVVYDLARAVARSDADAVLDRLTPDVEYVVEGVATPSEATRNLIRGRILASKFDFVRVTHLRTNAGGQSRRGTAEFRVISGGSTEGPVNSLNFGSYNSSWSLGFRETSPGVWKVNRVAPVSTPGLPSPLPVSPRDYRDRRPGMTPYPGRGQGRDNAPRPEGALDRRLPPFATSPVLTPTP